MTKIMMIMTGALLAGCGGGGGGSGDQAVVDAQFETRLAEFRQLNTQVEGQAVNSTTPTFGTATYNGSANIAVGGNGAPRAIVGDAVVDVNLGNSQITGTLDNFFGTNGDNAERYAGSIAIGGNSSVTGGSFAVDYDGTLTSSSSDRIDLDGQLAGQFRGSNGASISAIDTSANVSGAASSGAVIVLGER